MKQPMPKEDQTSGKLKGRHFLSMLDLSTEEILLVLDTARELKSGRGFARAEARGSGCC